MGTISDKGNYVKAKPEGAAEINKRSFVYIY